MLLVLVIWTLCSSHSNATDFSVINNNDTGVGSLRWAIESANADTSPPHTIVFSIAGDGPHVITTVTELPQVERETSIDASGEAIAGAPGVQLDGAGLTLGSGLNFSPLATGSSVSYLSITNFPSYGVFVQSGSTDIINNFLGVAPDGVTVGGNGSAGIRSTAKTVYIGRTVETGNVISGNLQYGILIGGTVTFTVIRNNLIGTTASGDSALPNGISGILVTTGYSGTIGGTRAGYGNVISGNTGDGITLGSNTQAWKVEGNIIGLAKDGQTPLPNGNNGIRNSGDENIIGYTSTAGRNVISANDTGIFISSGSIDSQIVGNYIGTNASGNAGAGGQNIGIRASGTINSCTIGGNWPESRNVISGNSSVGVSINTPTRNCKIHGNYIGTSADGLTAIPNGVGVELGGTNNALGGGLAQQGNLISGNTLAGVNFNGGGNTMYGNLIGLNAPGTAALGNGEGVRTTTTVEGKIGGTGDNQGNVISGNLGNGVTLGAGSRQVQVLANLVGTNPAGTAAIPNAAMGISAGGQNQSIGGNSEAARNVVSGNSQAGIRVSGTEISVLGNYIGTNAAGLVALGNGVLGSGIQVGSNDNTIGMPGAGNVIAGMTQNGIELINGASNNTIQANWIGTNQALDPGLGNTQAGIFTARAYGNYIGGMANGEANIIAFNSFMGVRISRGDNNEITGNSIFDNGLLGIDVGKLFEFPNDPADPDTTANRSQNYPLLSSVIDTGTMLEVTGVLQNEPDTQYRVELFSSPACDETGMGEGRTYLGSIVASTGPAGTVSLDDSLELVLDDGFVSATVTDSRGNTSGFSPCAEVGGSNPGQIQFFHNLTRAQESDLNGEVIITRSHGMTGSVSVEFTISDDTAFAGADYTDMDQTVTFLDGETLKVVKVPIVLDPATEDSQEEATLSLTAPTGGATLGLADSQLVIMDANASVPLLRIDDTSAYEGNAGQTVMVFEVHLTATDHPLEVQYQVESGTALEGSDYVFSTGTINFAVSAAPQVKTIEIEVVGDTDIEDDEIFWVQLLGTSESGAGQIVNDDGIETVTITLDKLVDVPTYSLIGDEISYTYQVTSSGTGAVAGPISVIDSKLSVNCPEVSSVGNADNKLDPGESLVCTASHIVVQADIEAGFITNTATASGNNAVSNEDVVTVTYLEPLIPALTLDKSSDVHTFSALDDVIIYSYLVTSSGTGAVAGPISVIDSKLSVNCPEVSSVGNADSKLDPGESLVCTASHIVVQADINMTFITNTATAFGDATISNEDMLTVYLEHIFRSGFESTE